MLFVRAGESLSLQFHRVKDEAWYVQSGRAKIELGNAGEAVLNEEIVAAPAYFRFEPGTVHRVTALEDTTIIEVSTPELDDVVRLEDRYGRAGLTSLERAVRRAPTICARGSTLHARFSTNPYPYPRWVFDGYDFGAIADVLEVGCGDAIDLARER